jgi:hypothetical protein
VIERLKKDILAQEKALSIMPQQDESLPFDAYGYHSSYLPVLDELPKEPRWTIGFKTDIVEGLYLIPAVDRRGLMVALAKLKTVKLQYSHQPSVTQLLSVLELSFIFQKFGLMIMSVA